MSQSHPSSNNNSDIESSRRPSVVSFTDLPGPSLKDPHHHPPGKKGVTLRRNSVEKNDAKQLRENEPGIGHGQNKAFLKPTAVPQSNQPVQAKSQFQFPPQSQATQSQQSLLSLQSLQSTQSASKPVISSQSSQSQSQSQPPPPPPPPQSQSQPQSHPFQPSHSSHPSLSSQTSLSQSSQPPPQKYQQHQQHIMGQAAGTGSGSDDDGKIHILLACTGSVATIKIGLIINKLKQIYEDQADFQLILTSSAEHFMTGVKIPSDVKIWHDNDEWDSRRGVAETMLHVRLRRWADVLLIAPLSANTLAKIANGICNNLITSVIRSWNPAVPILVAPAMNTHMFTNPMTAKHLKTIENEFHWIETLMPVEKVLVCGDLGLGAMMEWSELVDVLVDRLGGPPEEEEEEESEKEASNENETSITKITKNIIQSNIENSPLVS